MELIRAMLLSAIYEWQLHITAQENKKTTAEVRAQSAEYSAIFDLIGKISVQTNKRDTIEKVKEIFLTIFGTQNFKYWDNDYDHDSLPKEIEELFFDQDQTFIHFEKENRFCIKVHWNERLYGVIDVSGFLFPEYIQRYRNFAIEIVKILGLALSNNEHYEKVLKSEEELQYLSFHDALTGLYNRTYLNDLLKRPADTIQPSVYMFDIDKLKYVNDNFGHAEGDKLIINVAEILEKSLRETDTVARIGGDEFVAILPETDEETAEIIKERITYEIMDYNRNIQEAHLKIGISMGFAAWKGNKETIENLIQKADKRMYQDKNKKSLA